MPGGAKADGGMEEGVSKIRPGRGVIWSEYLDGVGVSTPGPDGPKERRLLGGVEEEK